MKQIGSRLFVNDNNSEYENDPYSSDFQSGDNHTDNQYEIINESEDQVNIKRIHYS